MSEKPVEVFYSYADADATFVEALEKHLSMLRYEGKIATWHKCLVTAGADWQREIITISILPHLSSCCSALIL